ncbi:hypothetical protein BGZ60DRAFT_208485 [Tricladium varicosporioides]|nr:hypothetical protein BGZ60DRAFT_208485 [Hymenoscyphus varicosporioides]
MGHSSLLLPAYLVLHCISEVLSGPQSDARIQHAFAISTVENRLASLLSLNLGLVAEAGVVHSVRQRLKDIASAEQGRSETRMHLRPSKQRKEYLQQPQLQQRHSFSFTLLSPYSFILLPSRTLANTAEI